MDPDTSIATSSLVSNSLVLPIWSKSKRRLGRMRVSLRRLDRMLPRKPPSIIRQLIAALALALILSTRFPPSEPHCPLSPHWRIMELTPSTINWSSRHSAERSSRAGSPVPVSPCPRTSWPSSPAPETGHLHLSWIRRQYHSYIWSFSSPKSAARGMSTKLNR